MDLQTGISYLIFFANNSVYPAQGLLALYGAFQVILVLQRLRAKQFSSGKAADKFMEDVHGELRAGNLEGVASLCDTPAHWTKAVPQLILVALANQDRDLPSIRRLLGESFDREVLSDLQYRMSWINTVIKSEPMLGLLGTVLGMIEAFGKIAASTRGRPQGPRERHQCRAGDNSHRAAGLDSPDPRDVVHPGADGAVARPRAAEHGRLPRRLRSPAQSRGQQLSHGWPVR